MGTESFSNKTEKMSKLKLFIDKYFNVISLTLLLLIFLRTCSSEVKPINKRLDSLTEHVDSLTKITVTHNDLRIEGLKTEKRMIQSTDRKILDVNRQSEIDRELENLQ